MKTIKLTRLNERQYYYLMEILRGCVEDTLNTSIGHDMDGKWSLGIDELDFGSASITRRDCMKLLKKLDKVEEEE